MHIKEKQTVRFFCNVKSMYASALGIEILCILSAEVGQNTGLLFFGLQNPFGIMVSYAMGYGFAGFATFATILGRLNFDVCVTGCCSALEQNVGFVSNLKSSFRNFAIGIQKIPTLHGRSDFSQIVRTSLYILVASESICIVTAETVNLAFFRHTLWLSIPLSILAGALAITVVEAYRRSKINSINN